MTTRVLHKGVRMYRYALLSGRRGAHPALKDLRGILACFLTQMFTVDQLRQYLLAAMFLQKQVAGQLA